MKFSHFIKAMFIAIATTLTLANTAMAQSKTLVVDYNKIVNDSKAGKSILGQMKAIQKTVLSEYSAEIKNLQTQQKQLQETAKNLPKNTDINTRPDIKQKIETFAYTKQKTALEGKYKDAEMEKTQKVALRTIYLKMDAIIANIARERGADVVTDTNATYYNSTNVDITSTVLTRLDSQLPYVSVTRQRITRQPIKQAGK